MSIAAELVLTPSEALVIHAHEFSPARKSGGYAPLLKPDTQVEYPPLAQALLAVALLASEEAGALRLELVPKKTLFGLRTVTRLLATPTGAAAAWPEDTLEAKALLHAKRLSAKGKHEVVKVLYEVQEMIDLYPESEVVTNALRPLLKRGALEVVTTEKVKLKVFKSKEAHHVLSEAGEQAARALGADPARALLERCRRDRPEIWARLEKDVRTAIAQRERPSDGGQNFD